MIKYDIVTLYVTTMVIIKAQFLYILLRHSVCGVQIQTLWTLIFRHIFYKHLTIIIYHSRYKL